MESKKNTSRTPENLDPVIVISDSDPEDLREGLMDKRGSKNPHSKTSEKEGSQSHEVTASDEEEIERDSSQSDHQSFLADEDNSGVEEWRNRKVNRQIPRGKAIESDREESGSEFIDDSYSREEETRKKQNSERDEPNSQDAAFLDDRAESDLSKAASEQETSRITGKRTRRKSSFYNKADYELQDDSSDTLSTVDEEEDNEWKPSAHSEKNSQETQKTASQSSLGNRSLSAILDPLLPGDSGGAREKVVSTLRKQDDLETKIKNVQELVDTIYYARRDFQNQNGEPLERIPNVTQQTINEVMALIKPGNKNRAEQNPRGRVQTPDSPEIQPYSPPDGNSKRKRGNAAILSGGGETRSSKRKREDTRLPRTAENLNKSVKTVIDKDIFVEPDKKKRILLGLDLQKAEINSKFSRLLGGDPNTLVMKKKLSSYVHDNLSSFIDRKGDVKNLAIENFKRQYTEVTRDVQSQRQQLSSNDAVYLIKKINGLVKNVDEQTQWLPRSKSSNKTSRAGSSSAHARLQLRDTSSAAERSRFHQGFEDRRNQREARRRDGGLDGL